MKKVQKLLSIVLALCITASFVPTAFAESASENLNVTSFGDIATTDYYYEPVLWAVINGITAGTSESTFSPTNTCTRGQIITFLWRAEGSPEPSSSNSFTDVSNDEYYYKAVQWAYENGIDESTGTFKPDSPCTRAMAVEYLWKLAGSPKAASDDGFTDVSSNVGYADAVAWAVEQGITTGTSSTKFSPTDTCTRGQIVTFLYRNDGSPNVNLVTSAYSKSAGNMSFEIPQINIDSDYVTTVNKEIWDTLYTGVAEECITFWEQAGVDFGQFVSYEWHIRDNILSVLIESHPLEWLWDYYVYNIDISTGASVSASELLSVCGISESEYKELVRQALYSVNFEGFKQGYNNAKNESNEKQMSFVNETLAQTISDENVAEAIPYIGNEGQLSIVGKVYSLAEATYYYHVINIEDFELASSYPNLFGDSTTDIANASYTRDKQIYTEYLLNGGYDELGISGIGTTSTIKTCMADINNDGTYELLISVNEHSYGNVFCNDTLLEIRDGAVNKVISAGGGGMSTYYSSLSFVYDNDEQQYMVALYDSTENGEFCTYFYYIYSDIIASQEADTVYGETQLTSAYQGSIDNVKNSTSLYYEDGSWFSFYTLNNSYISKPDYGELNLRFTTPTDEAYQMKAGTYSTPIN